jgi:hypothetical protein
MWTATDDCDNSSSCDQIITVDDSIAPVLTVPANITIECDESTDPSNTGQATATDNCDPAPLVTYTDVSVGVCPEVITRTWVATDACGNSSSGDQIITLDDTTAPVLTVPPNVTIECDESTDPSNTGQATATDNCDPAPVITYADVSTGTCPEIITRTWRATDACGNPATGVQTITLDDTTDPVLTVPQNVTIECAGSTDPVDTGHATATDNCDPAPVVTYSDVSMGVCPQIITRTWVATDACGNSASADQTITLDDTIAPVLTVPPNVIVGCNEPTDPSNTGVATATDNCDPAPLVTWTDMSLGTCPEIITRTWTATDECDNSANGVQTITLDDTEAPAFVYPPGNATVECDNVPPPATPTATDNCDTDVDIAFDEVRTDGTCPDNYTLTRTWTATDDCDNAAVHVQTITVQDTTLPVLSGGPADDTVECDSVPPPATPTATDNCDVDVDITFNEVRTDGTCPDNYTLTRTWTATDDCGNSSAHVQTITVQDTTAPGITCPPDEGVTVPEATDPSATGIATATDACDVSPAIVWSDAEAFLGFCPTTTEITRTWRAIDACDNQGSCDQIIEVFEPLPPGMCCNPADGTLTPIDDGDPCTDDICNTTTGEVTHPDNGLCNPCCNINGPATCEEVFVQDCPDPADYMLGQTCEGDDDGDGYVNACDTCPGIDDAIHGPCPPGMIPTVSEWGLVIMALLLLVVGKVFFGIRSRGLIPA